MPSRTKAKSLLAVMSGLVLLGAAAGLAPAVLGQTTTVTVLNAPPVLVSVVVLPSVQPTAGTTTSVQVTITASDLNGYQDITSVSVEVFKPDGATSHVAVGSAAFSSSVTALEAIYTYSFNMSFHDDPATLADPYEVVVTVTDAAAAAVSNTLTRATFAYAQLLALDLPASPSIDFGSSLTPGGTSTIQSLAVTNAGNVPMDIQISGTDLEHSTESASIAVGNIDYSGASNMDGEMALTTTAQTDDEFSLAKGASSSKPTYWQLNVPDDQFLPSGTYSGTVTIAAAADS